MAPRILIRASSAIDARGETAPASLLVEGGEIIEIGTPQQVGDVPDARIVDATDAVVLPGLVNAHCHLDLSGPGPVPFTGSFASWLDEVLHLRGDATPESMAAAVGRGIELSLAGGTAFVGDIAGVPRTTQLEVLRSSPLGGTCFPEFFGLGTRQQAAIEEMDSILAEHGGGDRDVLLGLSPHATYSCGPRAISHAVDRGVPVAIHVSESLEEARFLADGSGAFREKIERLGAWNEGVEIPGTHPVDYILDLLGDRPALLVHLNYVEPRHLDLLADANVTVAYCPRASDYFGHPSDGHHAYQAMIDHGIPVALGTDSLLCLDTPDRISVLDEMRHLHRRDGTEVSTLMTMATHHAARGLGLDPSLVDFSPGATGGVIAVGGVPEGGRFVDALHLDEPPRWLVPPVSS
ncbi:MAG: amidohydrolase family protein [Phycisphaerales bacterium]|nr:amidohydrolase family protein [Phycisphaerales bacterium]